MGRRSFALKQGGDVRYAPYAVGIRKQVIMQVVEVKNGELVDGALPAAGQQEEDGR